MSITLAQVIAEVESGGNPYAIRFEPTIYQRLIVGSSGPSVAMGRIQSYMKIAAPDANIITLAMIASTSWGKYQILGDNLYNPMRCRLSIPIGLFMSDISSQEQSFADFVASKRVDISSHMDFSTLTPALKQDFADFYNGDAAFSQYVARMNVAYEKLSQA